MYSSAKSNSNIHIVYTVLRKELNLIRLGNCNYSLDLVKRRLPEEGLFRFKMLVHTNNFIPKT